jgi:hypothetical protein
LIKLKNPYTSESLINANKFQLGKTEEETTNEPNNRSNTAVVPEEEPTAHSNRMRTHGPIYKLEVQGSQTSRVLEINHVIIFKFFILFVISPGERISK